MPDLPLALFAGILTIAAPCTLPVLPILLGASIGQRAGTRPAFIAAGFVASFASVALALSRAFPEKRAAKRCLSVVTAKRRNSGHHEDRVGSRLELLRMKLRFRASH